MDALHQHTRTVGFWGATGVGVGAIVGGGVLALAGVAFSTAGPGAIVAFALNGLVAVATAFSFAEMAAAFPESGGTYTFSKKVLSIQAAFLVGWIVWFASIVAAVLYALGFSSYAVVAIDQLWRIFIGEPPFPFTHRIVITLLAIFSTGIYTLSLIRKSTGGGQWATIGKIIVFAIIILGGMWAFGRESIPTNMAKMKPFFTKGLTGLFQAMGYTFIALQGFDIIAAVAGEVRNPGKVLPKSMLFSLVIALTVYLPLIFLVSTVGVPGGSSITAISAEHPETVVADAAGRFLGPFGYWLVIAAAILAMLSALNANLLASSRVALAMSHDRTLPKFFSGYDPVKGTPRKAILVSAVTVVVILLIIPDIAAAGAAASLIFLISFALAHWTSILARVRAGKNPMPFRTPFFPVLPIAGGVACLALAVFQGFSVPSAGMITAVWLAIGSVLYLFIFARRAQVVDAAYEARDPQLVRLRGRNPLVLVPIANPENAGSMVAVANAMAPQHVGKVLLLFVVNPPDAWKVGESPSQLSDSLAALNKSLTASFAAGLEPEALTTVAQKPWTEIIRVSHAHHCESLLLGFSNLETTDIRSSLERIISQVRSDVVVLRARKGWQMSDVKKILVPIGGYSTHNRLRARLLGSLSRMNDKQITYLRVLKAGATRDERIKTEHATRTLCEDEIPGEAQIEIICSNHPADVVVEQAAKNDLILLGLQKIGRTRVFGDIVLRISNETDVTLIMISQK